jgi:NitT/TauT family transport system substrate-binding protein
MRRALAIAMLVFAACGGHGGSDRHTVRVALNWKPEPEFGGLYQALDSGAFTRRGLDVEVTGGPGAPVVQMIDSGQVEFGVVSADEVLMARDRGADIVAVFATYQTNPQGIMLHAERHAASLPELFAEGGRLAVEPGLPYVKYLQQQFDFSKIAVVPYSYSIGPFLSDPELAQQVFVTAEPIAARRAGVEVRVFLIADSGFNPYAAVCATRGARVRESPDIVEAFAAGLRDGWVAYLQEPGAANEKMAALNTEMDSETFEKAAAAQRPLIEGGSVDHGAPGAMANPRWGELGRQLQALGLLDHPAKPAECWFDPNARSSH